MYFVPLHTAGIKKTRRYVQLLNIPPFSFQYYSFFCTMHKRIVPAARSAASAPYHGTVCNMPSANKPAMQYPYIAIQKITSTMSAGFLNVSLSRLFMICLISRNRMKVHNITNAIHANHSSVMRLRRSETPLAIPIAKKVDPDDAHKHVMGDIQCNRAPFPYPEAPIQTDGSHIE